jgi:hypothetical protein
MVLVSFGFFYSAELMLAKKASQIDQQDRLIKRYQEQVNSAKVVNDELKEVSTVIKNSLTDKRELSVDEANNFIRELAELADTYKIAVHALFPKVSFLAGNLLEQQFALELDCTYIQLGQFLASIDRYDYLIKVNTLDVRSQGSKERIVEDNRQTLYKVILDLSIFKIVKESNDAR